MLVYRGNAYVVYILSTVKTENTYSIADRELRLSRGRLL